jgi:hypothetical protein
VYATIEAVEQFVDHHEAQVRSLQDQPALQPLGQTLLACQGDEVATATAAARAPASERWFAPGAG